MIQKNKNHTVAKSLEQITRSVGFVAMTTAGFLLMAPHGISAGHEEKAGKDPHHTVVAAVDHSNGHERMEEIRHDPVSYGTLMRSPSTAGSQ